MTQLGNVWCSKKNKIRPLRPVLKKWRNILQKYNRVVSNDLHPYANNERTNTGLLAAAIWTSGGTHVALEEFRVDRKDKNSSKRVGRSDLWFTLKKGDWEDGYNLEAKRPLFPLSKYLLSKGLYLSQELRGSMQQATKALQSLHPSECAHNLLAAVFVVPQFSNGELSNLTKKEKEKIVSDFFDDLQSQVKNQGFDFYAEYRPSSKKLGKNKEGWRYPGIALVGQVYR